MGGRQAHRAGERERVPGPKAEMGLRMPKAGNGRDGLEMREDWLGGDRASLMKYGATQARIRSRHPERRARNERSAN